MKIIGLVDFHSSTDTNACIESVRGASDEVQLVVVDNGGDFRPQHDDVAVISPGKNIGFAAACNLLLDYSRGNKAEWLWLLNNDCVLRSDAVRVMENLRASVKADVYTSVTLLGDTNRVWYAGGRTNALTFRQSHSGYGVPYDRVTKPHWPTDWASGASMFLPKETIETCGPFDEHLFLYLEELEWQQRHAFTVAVSSSPVVRHYAGSTTRTVGNNVERFFSARNWWIVSQRKSRLMRAYLPLFWALDYIIKPLVKGQPAAVRAAVLGFRSRHISGPDALDRLLRSSRPKEQSP